MAIEAARVLAITFASPWNFGFCTPLLQFLALGLGFCLRDGHGCGGDGGGPVVEEDGGSPSNGG
jgi:hypothetical protein